MLLEPEAARKTSKDLVKLTLRLAIKKTTKKQKHFNMGPKCSCNFRTQNNKACFSRQVKLPISTPSAEAQQCDVVV